MKNLFMLTAVTVLSLIFLSSCAKYDYHSRVEITNEDQLDYDAAELEAHPIKSIINNVS